MVIHRGLVAHNWFFFSCWLPFNVKIPISFFSALETIEFSSSKLLEKISQKSISDFSFPVYLFFGKENSPRVVLFPSQGSFTQLLLIFFAKKLQKSMAFFLFFFLHFASRFYYPAIMWQYYVGFRSCNSCKWLLLSLFFLEVEARGLR